MALWHVEELAGGWATASTSTGCSTARRTADSNVAKLRKEAMYYSGDEYASDDVTSGPIEDESICVCECVPSDHWHEDKFGNETRVECLCECEPCREY